MTTLTEQFSATSKANFEAHIALFNQFASKTFEGVEKLIDLHLKATKSSLEEVHNAIQKLLSVKDAQEFFSLSNAHPGVEKSLAYSRHVVGILSSTQAELTKTAEAQLAEANRKVILMIDEASAPTNPAISFVKATIGNVNASYEQFTKNARQAAEALESNVSTAVDQLSQVAMKAGNRSAKK